MSEDRKGIALLRTSDFPWLMPILLSLLVGGLLAFAGMYYGLQSVNETMRRVVDTLEKQTVTINTLTNQGDLIRYRVEKLEQRKDPK